MLRVVIVATMLASYTCFSPQGTAARIVNRAEVTAGPSSTT